MLFDWDTGNWPKCGKHGVSKAEIEAVFEAPAIYGDPAHSGAEQRFKAIGRTAEGRYALVAFTVRDKADGLHYRPISARYMHQKEIDYYEQTRP